MLPQILFLLVELLDLVWAGLHHGRPWGESRSELRVGLWCVGVTFIIWGGFFAEIGVAQVILWVLLCLSVIGMSTANYQSRTHYYNFPRTLVESAIGLGLLYFGGFFGGLL